MMKRSHVPSVRRRAADPVHLATPLAMALFVGVMSLGAAACAAPAPDGETEEASLRAAAVAYQSAASAKDRDGVVAFYDESALMIPPGAELVEGLEGVGAFRFGFIETPGVELEFDLVRAEVSRSGDVGWTFAVGNITITGEDGSVTRDVVRDFHTWRRQPDGSWRVVVDMWNSGAPSDG